MNPARESDQIIRENGVRVPMRDGVHLDARVFRPAKNGKYPAIVQRHGYGGEGADKWIETYGDFYPRYGYVFVFCQTRGRYRSEGVFSPWVDDAWGEHQDGYDTIEWAAEQPWSDGNVGTLGFSYGAAVQYFTMPTRPPSLKACFAVIGFCSQRDFVYRAGAYVLGLHRSWSMDVTVQALQHETAPKGSESNRLTLEQAKENIDQWYKHLPIKDLPALEGVAPWYFRELDCEFANPKWSKMDFRTQLKGVDVPIYHVGGWYDLFLQGTIDAYEGVSKHGKSTKCRANQRLVIGPWMHSIPLFAGGDIEFGDEVEFDHVGEGLKWFNRWLKGEESSSSDDSPVRLFLVGENRWIEMDSWPPPNVVYQPIYLREGSSGSGESLNDGCLSFDIPAGAEEADSYDFDPSNPIESVGFLGFPPNDYSGVEARMLTYTSPVLEETLNVVGPVKAVLYASSSSRDTDWVVRLCDVWPDGRSIKVCDGILRARYRDQSMKESLLVPDEVYRFDVDLWAAAQSFLPGHRLRVQVTSSDFPRHDPNLNTGGLFGEETEGVVASNTVFHDESRPSHVLLPKIPGRRK